MQRLQNVGRGLIEVSVVLDLCKVFCFLGIEAGWKRSVP